MPITITYTHRCINCYTKIAILDLNNISRYEDRGFIYNKDELENVNIVNNIVQCRQCRANLGIKRINDNDTILFAERLQAEAFIQTRF